VAPSATYRHRSLVAAVAAATSAVGRSSDVGTPASTTAPERVAHTTSMTLARSVTGLAKGVVTTSEPSATQSVAAATSQAEAYPARQRAMPRRRLGMTDRQLSIVGFGGMVVKDVTDQDAAEMVRQAIDWGINFFDVAPAYGNAEDRLGPALQPYRKDVFLACKTTERTRAGAEADLIQSLHKARSDHFDLYQFHMVTGMSEVETIMGPGGALEAVLAARDAGKVTYVGFSAHDEGAALAMLERFEFDTILFPVNWIAWHAGNFGPRVLQRAQEQGLGILAIKSLARQPRPADSQPTKWPKCWYEPVDTPEEVLLGMRFTLSKPVTSAVSAGYSELLWLMCDAVPHLTPLTADEDERLAERSKEYRPLFSA
jgi:predicted aldo/keto reductase-like oxidoreductase